MKTRICIRHAFTLIELLVVIAIIAILTAILFPVFAGVRKNMGVNSCMSNLQRIGQAVKLYDIDNGHYPASLAGFAQVGGGGFYTGTGTPLPFDSPNMTYRPLATGPKYIQDKDVFICPHSDVKSTSVVTTAYYPLNAGSALANTQVMYTQVDQHAIGNSVNGGKIMPDAFFGGNGQPLQPAWFYAYDSYDVGPRIDKNGNAILQNGSSIMELHYSLDWTGGQGSQDPHNQLKYNDAPANTTIITWCTYHGAKAHMDRVPVLFLSGGVKSTAVSGFIPKGPLSYQE